ncbi:MAG TPA: 6-carboxytetrahydropterin synthase [Polyangiaceae bacterium]|nr:6-carboxytetrahydropterin synthase [Polyangiaceae bacterium]
MRLTTLDLTKEDMKFSAGHFTIFSATERERLHGHNFTVSVSLVSSVGSDGLAIDYGIYKRKIVELCREWNEYFLLPGRSPHLAWREQGDYVQVRFAKEEFAFLRADVIVLPVANVTLEELAPLFLQKLVAFRAAANHEMIRGFTVRIFSGPGQSASASWDAT